MGNSKGLRTTILVLSAWLILNIGLLLIFDHIQNKRDLELQHKQTELVQQQNKLKSLRKSVRLSALKMASESSNATIRLSSKQELSQTLAEKTSTGFFKAYMTYSNGQSFRARKFKATAYASSSVTANKTLFSSGQDTLGGDYIDTMQLHSTFVSAQTTLGPLHGDTVSGLVQVAYQAWKGDSTPGHATDLYKITYDNKLNKLTGVKKLTNLYLSTE